MRRWLSAAVGLVVKFGHWALPDAVAAGLPPPDVLRRRVKTVALSWLGLLVFVANVVPGDRVLPASLGLAAWLLWVGLDNAEAIPGLSARLGGLYEASAFFLYSLALPVTGFYLAVPLLQLRHGTAALFAGGGLVWVLMLSIREYRGIYRPIRTPVAGAIYAACLATALWTTRSTLTHVPRAVPVSLWVVVWLVLGLLAAAMFYAAVSGWRIRTSLFVDPPRPTD